MRERLNKQLSWRVVLLIIAIMVVVVFLIFTMSNRQIRTQELTTDDADFQKAVVEEQIETLITALNEEDYAYAQSISTEKLKPYMEKEEYEKAKTQVSDDWGDFVSMGTIYTGKATQKGKVYAVGQVAVSYENVAVTYNITFNDSMQLAGFFFK